MDLSLFEEVWYTGQWELPVTCRVAEQKLSFEISSLKLQLDFVAQTIDAISGSWKHIGPNIHLSQNPGKCSYLSPRAVHLRKVCGGHRPPMDELTLCMTGMSF